MFSFSRNFFPDMVVRGSFSGPSMGVYMAKAGQRTWVLVGGYRLSRTNRAHSTVILYDVSRHRLVGACEPEMGVQTMASTTTGTSKVASSEDSE